MNKKMHCDKKEGDCFDGSCAVHHTGISAAGGRVNSMNDKPKALRHDSVTAHPCKKGCVLDYPHRTCKVFEEPVPTHAQDGDKREWEEEFYNIFCTPNIERGGWQVISRITGESIIPFIRSIESRAIERTLAEAREVVWKNEEMELDMNRFDKDVDYRSAVLGYQRACDDIARALTKKK